MIGFNRDRTGVETSVSVFTAVLPWLAGFVALRGLVVWFAFDAVFFWEEAYRLLVAEALLSGWDIPVHDLQADPYAGGSLVLSILAVPAVALFGSSMAALKGVAIVWSAAGLLVWFYTIDRFFGRSPAHVFAGLWVLSPPLFTIYNVVAMGSHAETVTLAGLQTLFLLRFVCGERQRSADLLAWMIVAGLSIWFTYVSAVTFLVYALYALAAGVLPVRRWPLAAAGLLLGLAPWLVHNALTAGAGLAVLGPTFQPLVPTGMNYPQTLLQLVTWGLPVALQFRDVTVSAVGTVLARELPAYLYWVIVWAAWGFCMLRAGRSVRGSADTSMALRDFPELALLALVAVFPLLIAASSHGFNELGVVPFLSFRILVPAFPVVFLAPALAVGMIGPKARNAVLGALLVVGVLGNAQLLTAPVGIWTEAGRDPRILGSQAMGHLLVYKHADDLDTILERVGALPTELRSASLEGVGFQLAYLYGFGHGYPEGSLRADLLALEAEQRSAVIDGIQTALGPGTSQVRPVPESTRTSEIVGLLEELVGSKLSD